MKDGKRKKRKKMLKRNSIEKIQLNFKLKMSPRGIITTADTMHYILYREMYTQSWMLVYIKCALTELVIKIYYKILKSIKNPHKHSD